MKRWVIKTPHPKLQKEISDALNIHPVIAQLLVNRDITSVEDAKHFFYAHESKLHDPFLLKDMDKAVARIKQAQDNRESVLIFGDYDVDGVTSSALLRRTLKRLGIEAINYIPHRMDEGYGLNHSIVEFAKERGIHLIITVDCGINAVSEVKAINAGGMDVIVLDHHEPDGDNLPKAVAVIDPKRHDCKYPFKNLAAVGLVGKLAQALLGKIPDEEWDLIAIGTVADVVTLRGENRIFVKKGLPVIERTNKSGLMALLDVAKIRGKKIKPYYIGFILGPRLNAAGRMDSATIALDLLLSDKYENALALAQSLESHNLSRQKMQSEVVDEAIAMIEASTDLKGAQIIVVHKEGWHKGVLGIVASKIVERYYRPTIVISVEGGLGTGSARSIEGFHLVEALTNCADSLETYGGHKRAAGLKVRHENIDAFRDAINIFAKGTLNTEALVPSLDIDCEVPFFALSLDFANLVEDLEPHGEGNPSPLLCTRNLTVKSPAALMGKGTIKFWVTDGKISFSAVGFGMTDYQDMIKPGQKVDLAYSLIIDDWNKAPVVQLKLKDIRLSEV
jgi:single-stranded-DNA-specific exonuclease